MNNTKTLFVTPNEKLLCIKGTEHLFSVCHKTSDFVTETIAENIKEKTAHLFAAAPELLAILNEVCMQHDMGLNKIETSLYDIAKAALRKAKGEA